MKKDSYNSITKKKLYEDNQKLRELIKTYGEFWEIDMAKEFNKQKRVVLIIAYIIIGIIVGVTLFFLGGTLL